MSVRSYNRVPFQLLEITLISAQDLALVSRSMQTYAMAWVNPDRRLTTRVDQHGHAHPSWNDKFVFRVDDNFLSSATSAVNIEIYAVSWLRDVKLGAVRVLVSSLIPPGPDGCATPDSIGNMRFVALQIRRPSGRPQGILNVGVELLDSAMKSMPLYTELSASAVGYRDLMDGRKQKTNQNPTQFSKNQLGGGGGGDAANENETNQTHNPPPPPQLRKSKSERTATEHNNQKKKLQSRLPSSICAGSVYNGSIANGSDIGFQGGGDEGGGGGSLCSDLGPSPSVVAVAVAKGLYRPQAQVALNDVVDDDGDDDAGSSVLGDWMESDSVEGLRSKLERWRTEMPPLYDRNYTRARRANNIRSRRNTRRRHTDGGGRGGLFSCFANAYGCEFSITCGGNAKPRRKKSGNGKIPPSSSESSMSQSSIYIFE